MHTKRFFRYAAPLLFVAGVFFPLVSNAAYNDVTLAANTLLNVGGLNFSISGSSAVVQSVSVTSTTLSVVLLSGSQITVSAPAGYTFSNDAGAGVSVTSSCTQSLSSIALSSNSGSPVTVTVTPTPNLTCTGTVETQDNSSGGGNGNGTAGAAGLLLNQRNSIPLVTGSTTPAQTTPPSVTTSVATQQKSTPSSAKNTSSAAKAGSGASSGPGPGPGSGSSSGKKPIVPTYYAPAPMLMQAPGVATTSLGSSVGTTTPPVQSSGPQRSGFSGFIISSYRAVVSVFAAIGGFFSGLWH